MRFKNSSKILQNPLCPNPYASVDQLSRRRVERNLTGTKYERPGSDALSVWADCGRGFGSGDHRFHESVEGYPAEGKCQLPPPHSGEGGSREFSFSVRAATCAFNSFTCAVSLGNRFRLISRSRNSRFGIAGDPMTIALSGTSLVMPACA